MRRSVLGVRRWWGQQTVLSNAAFFTLNTLAGSALGFLFWTVAARNLDTAQLGVGAAYIAAIGLIGALGELGLGFTLIRFLPSLGSDQARFVNTASVAVSLGTAAITVCFITGVSLWSPDLGELANLDYPLWLFLITTVVFNVAKVLDKLFVSKQTTYVMFVRVLLANLLKLGVIALPLVLGLRLSAVDLVLAFGVSSAATLILSLYLFVPRAVPGYRVSAGLSWSLLVPKASYTLGNYLSQLLWSAPPLAYPLITLHLLGAEANAFFYTSWMLANILFIVPNATATAAFADAANQREGGFGTLWRVMRFTLLALVPAALLLSLFSGFVLGMFGAAYVAAGQGVFVVLLASALPYTVNTFIVTSYRVTGKTRALNLVSGWLAILSLVLAYSFGSLWGLLGVALGWLAAQSLGSVTAVLHLRYLQVPASPERGRHLSTGRILEKEL